MPLPEIPNTHPGTFRCAFEKNMMHALVHLFLIGINVGNFVCTLSHPFAIKDRLSIVGAID
jgi:hypothetical protein